MNYNDDYKYCIAKNDWKLIETNNQKICGLCCKTEHFYNDVEFRNKTFFSVNGVIIAIAEEYCENINIFGIQF